MNHKTMPYFIGLFTLLFVLTGCQQHVSETVDLEDIEEVTTTSQSVVTAKVGESCGHEGDKLCGSSLECRFDSDDIGTCVPKALDAGVVCSKERTPVCGQKGRSQVSYLNACEAQRHGAEIVYDGFCVSDETVIGKCGEKVFAVGNCAQRFTGFEYSLTEKRCDEVVVRGCELQAPFTTAGDCSAACVQG